MKLDDFMEGRLDDHTSQLEAEEGGGGMEGQQGE